MKQFMPKPAGYKKKVALVLQGGGALGSYQAGVYEALASSDYAPDWVAGISVGSLNAALIAGNAPEQRVAKLREFWETITTDVGPFDRIQTPAQFLGLERGDGHRGGALHALFLGQPDFFAPRALSEWWFGRSPTSYYDTAPLKSTLERLVDFDRINARETRFSVGAVNVRTGNFAYFDNAEIKIRPEHVMASGALPPGFPAVEIDGEHYWDGGLVSNTPLQYVIEYFPRRSHLIFQVDLFPAKGSMPENLSDVSERDKDIRYSSRTRAGTDVLLRMHDIRHNINTLWEQLPDELRATPAARFLNSFSCVTTMDIVELVYRPDDPQGQSKDYEFSRTSMNARWAQGLADAGTTLKASPWLLPMGPEVGARTFDVLTTSRQQDRTADATKAHA
jgi:NTE family protein